MSAETDSVVVQTSDGTPAEFIYTNSAWVPPAAYLQKGRFAAPSDAYLAYTQKDSVKILEGVVFRNLNRRITSIFIQPNFAGAKEDYINVYIEYTDGESIRGGPRTLYKGYHNDNYISFQPCGKVSELKVKWVGKVNHIAVNKQVPLRFSGLRLAIVSFIIFAVISLWRKKLRAKAAYLLFEYKFDPADKRQNRVYAFTVAMLIVFSCVCALTSTSKFFEEEYISDHQYNRFLVDALIAGRTYLDHGMPEMMLIAERPYDLKWLERNGYHRDVYWMSDWVYYNGKLYCYFGIVPAILLYVPYKLITGEYLSNNAGILLFVVIAVILMAMLWRFLAKKYMPGTLFVFYLLSFLALFFASGLFGPLRFTRFYSIFPAAGFMFIVAGIFLLLKSVEHEKPNRLKVIFACLCFALAVGCRPSLAVVSVIVPIVLWKYRSLRLAMFILAPYIIVAIPLCIYNYVRFGSIFDFGVNYNMTNINLAGYALLNPLGKLTNTFFVFLSYLFTVNDYSLFFPYVESIPRNSKFAGAVVMFYDKGSGMINFPIVFYLFFFFKSIFAKDKPSTFYLSSSFLIIAAVLIFLNSWLIGHSGRYTIDFAFFMILPSIFYAWYWCAGGHARIAGDPPYDRFRLKIVYTLLVISILVGLFLFAGHISNDPSPSNPVLFRYLQTSLGIPGAV
jgi:hypothetical protein